jgi:hypothetical protein
MDIKLNIKINLQVDMNESQSCFALPFAAE